MINTTKITKKFDNVLAVNDITSTIKEGQVFGLIGTNGAGKSTFLRMLCGIIKPDFGSILIDDLDVFENELAKQNLFYISDEQFYFLNSNAYDLANFYKNIYPNFSIDKFNEYIKIFNLPLNRKVKTYSKGMKKQLSVILAISSNTKYILCDETFDGLDPVMRQAVKSIFASEIESRGLTPIIASHNLREIEDICDSIGLLYNGGMLLSSDLDGLKLGIFKIQVVFNENFTKDMLKSLNILNCETRGSLYTLTIKDKLDKIELKLKELSPVFYEVLPLSLEEIFIAETEAQGYDIKKFIN